MAGILDMLAAALPRSIFANMQNANLVKGMQEAGNRALYGTPSPINVTPRMTDPGQFQQQEQAGAYAQKGMKGGLLDSVPQEQRPFIEGLASAMGAPEAIKSAFESNVSKPMSAYEKAQIDLKKGEEQDVWEPFTPEADPYGLGGVGQRNKRTGQISGYVKPEKPEAGKTPTVHDFIENNDRVTRQWNMQTQKWDEIARAPRTAPESERGRSQQGDVFKLPNGSRVAAEFLPDKGYFYREGGKLVPLPEGAEPVTRGAGGYLTPQQFLKTRGDLQTEQQGLQRLNAYFKTVGGLDVGVSRMANDISRNIKTFFGNKLNVDELNQQVARGQLQGLLGLFRTDVVGPGVLTEYDAARVIDALGGKVDTLQSPQVVEQLLKQLYDSKMQRAQLLSEEVGRNAQIYGTQPMPITAPQALGGESPAQPAQPAKQIKNDADYDALPSGAEFIDPEGKRRRKP